MRKIDLLQKLLGFFAAIVALATIYYTLSAIWNIISVIIYSFPEMVKTDFWQNALIYIERGSREATLAYRWSGLVYSVADIFSFAMVFKYILDVIKAGTPFTLHAAKHMTWIGLKTIFLPLVAEVIALFIHLGYGVGSEYSDHMPVLVSIIFGIVLLFVSLLLHHGAELEEKLKNSNNEDE